MKSFGRPTEIINHFKVYQLLGKPARCFFEDGWICSVRLTKIGDGVISVSADGIRTGQTVRIEIADLTVIHFFYTEFLDPGTIRMPLFLEMAPENCAEWVPVFGYPVARIIMAEISLYREWSLYLKKPAIREQLRLALDAGASGMRAQGVEMSAHLFREGVFSVVAEMISETRLPFVVFDTEDLTRSGPHTLNYRDYVLKASKKGLSGGDLQKKFRKIRDAYRRRQIRSEAVLPVTINDRVVGQLKYCSRIRTLEPSGLVSLVKLAQSLSAALQAALPNKFTVRRPFRVEALSPTVIRLLLDDSDLIQAVETARTLELGILKNGTRMLTVKARVDSVRPLGHGGTSLLTAKIFSTLNREDRHILKELTLRLKNNLRNDGN